jgi:hypothetical protein
MTELHVPGVSIAVVHNDQSSGHEGSVKPGRKALRLRKIYCFRRNLSVNRLRRCQRFTRFRASCPWTPMGTRN